jgi:hypothetical protein
MTSIRYNIIRLEVTEPGQAVEIRHRLPSHLSRCTGYIARHVKGIYSRKDLPEIGLLAVEFNSRKHLFFNDLIGYEAKVHQLPEYKQLNIPLEPGQLVTGYYLDTRKLPKGDTKSKKWFIPYTVAIYLRCEIQNNEQHVRSSCIYTTTTQATKH